MANFQCKIDIPNVKGLEDQQLTVGREFYLICDGEWAKNLKTENVSFVGDANMKYQLRVMKFEFRTPTEADIRVASYFAGPQKIQNLVLTDGEQSVELGPVEFEVQSVLPKGEKVEPFGPIGPATIPIPIFYWILLLGVILGAGLVVALRVWRFNQRRSMLERLKQHDSALTPIQEFHQNMRKLQRSNAAFYGKEATAEELLAGITELSRMFKMYISRRLSVPAFEWNERLILNDIKKYHPAIYTDHARKIRDLFSEFKKAQAGSQKLKAQDVLQLSESVRKGIEGLEKTLSQQVDSKARLL